MLLEIKNLCKTYGNQAEVQVKAVNNISLDVTQGDFSAIIGPSGSGKTTFLNLIAGLLLPSCGEILFQKKAIHLMSEKERTSFRLNNIGFIFQNYQLFPMLTAYENVELPLQLKEKDQIKIKDRIEKALELVGISSLAQRYPNQMSGGQQQRVSIARAIADAPSLILADEPTANLDSHTAHEIISLFKKLNKELNLTFLFSTHDPRLIDQVDRVLTMSDGIITGGIA